MILCICTCPSPTKEVWFNCLLSAIYDRFSAPTVVKIRSWEKEKDPVNIPVKEQQMHNFTLLNTKEPPWERALKHVPATGKASCEAGEFHCWNSQSPKKSKPRVILVFLRLGAPETTCLESMPWVPNQDYFPLQSESFSICISAQEYQILVHSMCSSCSEYK